MSDAPPDDFRRYGRSLQAWAVELSKRLDPESAGRLLLAASVTVLCAAQGPTGAARFLRLVADELDANNSTIN